MNCHTAVVCSVEKSPGTCAVFQIYQMAGEYNEGFRN